MSANSRMRRAISVAFLLLAVFVASATAYAAASKSAHRKTSSSTHTASHTSTQKTSKASPRSTRKKTTHRTTKRASARTRKASHTKAKKAVLAPKTVSATPESSVPSVNPTPSLTPGSTADVTAYAIGYRAGYKAGREAVLNEAADKGSVAKPTADTTPAVEPHTALQRDQNPQIANEADSQAGRAYISSSAPVTIAASSAEDDDAANDGPEDPDEATMATLELPSAGTRISLRGSLASLERQNRTLEAEGLERILDERDLSSRISHRLLVSLPTSKNLTVNPNLTETHRYCRPWTARFLTDLAKAHAAAFHRPFQVNSAVRTVEYQKHLMRTNGNAAAAQGDIVSPHLTGATIDIGKHGMTHAELTWMRRHLFALQSAGKIDVEEEFAQACFHITVYKTYTAPKQPRKLEQPELREASSPHREPSPAHRRGSSLPSSIAAGAFIPQSR